MLRRAATISEICDRCDQPARTRCRRCRRPLCRRHEPHRDRRCPRCETAFATRRAHLEGEPGRSGAATELLRLTPAIALASALVFGAIALLFGLAVRGGSGALYLGGVTFLAAFGLSALLYAVAVVALSGLGAAPAAGRRLRLGAARARFLREQCAEGEGESAAAGDEEE